MLNDLIPEEVEQPLPPEMEVDVSAISDVTPNEDGSIEVNLNPGEAEEEKCACDTTAHDANLAEALSENELAKIGQRVCELVDADERSRAEWKQRFEDGLKSIGLARRGDDYVAAYPGASDVVYPLLMEATIQFQARAVEELFPANGPVKASVIGEVTEEVTAQAERVEAHMNYQVLVEDTGYFDDLDQMLLYLPFGGSAFKKSWSDPVSKQTMSRYIKGDRLVLPYLASSLKDSPRVTQIIPTSPNTLKKYMLSGHYRDVDLPEPDETPPAASEGFDGADDREAVVPNEEGMYILYESHLDYDLPGDLADKDGIARPYTITVDKVNQKVLSIRRNWREDDEDKERREWFTHYKFLPGLGVYGFGWFHTIGGLGDAASGTLNAILDAAAFSTLQGGFKAKDSKIQGGQMTVEPGVYKDIDATFEELSKGFFTPNFKEPSPALFSALQLMVDIGRRFAMTTDATVGDGNNTGPVGTTVALIEQATKLLSGIHKRLHNAQGHEFRIRAELNADNLPDEYPFSIKGEQTKVLKTDYDERIDVVPVSDPNISSNAQRIAIAQGVLQLSKEAPQMYKTYNVHKMMLKALKAPNIDDFLQDPSDVPRADPVSEGHMVLIGMPIKPFADQDHDAHMAVHQGFMELIAGSPMEKEIAPSMMAHMADHMGHKFRLQISQMIGTQLPALDDEGKPQKMAAQIENMIAGRSAQAMMQMKQQSEQQAQQAQQGQSGQPQEQQPDPDTAKVQAEIARKDALAQAEAKRKDALAQAESARKDKAAMADIQRSVAQHKTDNQRQDAQDMIDLQREGGSA